MKVKNYIFKIMILGLLTSLQIFSSQQDLSKRSCLSNTCSLLSICSGTKTSAHYPFTITDIRNQTVTACKAGCWQLTQGGIFRPVSTSQSSPMIKITASHIELNFDGNFIENADTTNAGWVGIEVGYSPAELAANTSLRQPKDIVISNVHLRNFDCGIIVHKGVERVVIHESVILDASLGIVMLGDPASYPVTVGSQLNVEEVKNAAIVNCKIIGHSQNKRDALVNLKTLIETTYAYTTDLFMPLRGDRLNGNLLDVYTYSGILTTHVKNLLISCVDIQDIGNSDFTTEGNTTRTEGIGIILRDCDEVSIQHTKTMNTYGTVKAVGLQMERVCGINMYDSEFSYATSSYLAIGLQSFPDSLAKTLDGLSSGFDYTLEEIDLCEIKTEFQRSSDLAVGIYLTDTRGLNGQNVFAERNIATNASFGQVAITSVDITFTNSSFTRNISGTATTTLKNQRIFKNPFSMYQLKRSFGSLGTNDGVHTVGFYAENSNNTTLKNVNCSNNGGQNTARGMQLITCSNCNISDSSFSYNQVTDGKRTNEDTDIRTAQDASEISKHAPIVEQASTGGYGLVCQTNCEHINIINSKFEHNLGHRSAGLVIKDSSRVFIDQCSTSYQTSTGSFLHADAQGLTDNAVPFQSVHQSLFASDACDTDPSFTTVDYIDLLQDFLDNAREIREDQAAGTAVTFANQELVAAGISLTTASMARFRLWGSAIGTHLHNCQHFIIKNSTAVSQTSDKDSALGIVITGRSSEYEISECNLSYNEAWTDSKQTLWANSPTPTDPEERYQYDLSELKDFWYFTCGVNGAGWDHAATTSDIGFYTGVGKASTDPPDVMIAQGEQVFGSAGTTNTLPYVRPGGVGGPNANRHVINPFGPTAAGILISEIAISGYIRNNLVNGNFAHAGHGFGISLQNGFNTTITDNNIFNNGSNVYGFGTGLLDITSYSVNTYLRNFFNNNKVKAFVNANTIIPMGNVAGNSFQVDTLTNGNYDRNTRNLHNVELTVPIDTDACTVESNIDGVGTIQSNIINQWTGGNWVS